MKGSAFGCLKRYGEAVECFKQAEKLGNKTAPGAIAKCLRLLGN
jgi:hypothetical protein